MDKKVFFDIVRGPEGVLRQSQVDGLNFLLDNAEKYLEKEDFLRKFAYILATVKHETADSYEPIVERGVTKNTKYYPYYGRGYVQLTWKQNYQSAGDKIGVDLVQNPDLACNKDYAIIILFRGMQEGWFTGKALKDYIGTKSYEDDRRVVNGTDKSSLIAKYAVIFEQALLLSKYTLSAETKVIIPPEHESTSELSKLADWVLKNFRWKL